MRKAISTMLCLSLLTLSLATTGCSDDQFKDLKARVARAPIELAGAAEIVETLVTDEGDFYQYRVGKLLDVMKRARRVAEKADEKLKAIEKFDPANKAELVGILQPLLDGLDELTLEGEYFNIENPDKRKRFRATLVVMKTAARLLKQFLSS